MPRSTLGNPGVVVLALLIGAIVSGCATTPRSEPAATVAVGATADGVQWTPADKEVADAVRRVCEDGGLKVVGVWWNDGRLLVVLNQGRYHGLRTGGLVSIFDESGFQGTLELIRVDKTSAIAEVHVHRPGENWPL